MTHKVRKYEGKRACENLGVDERMILNRLNKQTEKCGLDSSDSVYVRVMASCRQDINLFSLKGE
jgi:hypothetical protein